MQIQGHPSLRVPQIAFAHRGASAHERENTIAAFQLALRLGATGLESDVWLTRDGIPVLHHDETFRIGLLRKSVRKTNRCDLPSYIPTLSDLYEKCGTGFELSLDIEHVEAGPVVMRVAEDAGAASSLWMCYWTIKTLVKWRSLNSNVKLVNSTRLARLKDGPERRAALLADEGVEALNLHYKDWNGGLTTLLHRFDRYAFAWDAQHTRILQNLLRMGIDGVYSDHVDRMVLAINRPEDQPL